MNGDPLPDTDHIARYCSPAKIGTDGIPLISAFVSRKNCLSVNWLEYLKTPTLMEAVRTVCTILNNKMVVKKKGRIAVLNVGVTKAAIAEMNNFVTRIEHDPTSNDASHSSVCTARPIGEDVAATMALNVITIYPIEPT